MSERFLDQSEDEVLLIGGSHNGEWIGTPQHPHIKMRRADVFGVEVYTGHRFIAGKAQWTVFVSDDMPIEQAFGALLESHHKANT